MSFLLPLLAVGVAFCLSQLASDLPDDTPLFPFLAAVLICSVYGGWVGGIVATTLSALVTAWVFRPSHSLVISGHDDLLRWLLFIFISLAISSLYASRNRAERAQGYSEQTLSLAMDSAHIGIWDYNLLTREFWWSKTLEIIYSRELDFPETYGQFFSCIHFDDQPLFNRAITRTIDEGDVYEVEHRIILPDKSIRWVRTCGRMFVNPEAHAERIIGVVFDITTSKNAEEMLQEL